jgi:cytochrome c biogenesis protein CcdA
VAGNTGFRLGVLTTAFGFGFRHGVDWDHIAALTDITSSQETSRRAKLFATLYALGHGLAVVALGLGAILLSANLPKSVDGVMERFVGATLILLGLYVFHALAKDGPGLPRTQPVDAHLRWPASRPSLGSASGVGTRSDHPRA